MTRSPSSASWATCASTDARSVSVMAHASSTASGAPFAATHAPSGSRHTALSRLRTGSNGYRPRRSLGARSPAASASARSTGSCAAAAPWAAAATVSTRSRSPSICSISSRFSVSVPVLSASSTVIAPTASAARSRRRSTPCCARRRPPIATSTVTRIGSSSGIVAKASVSPSSSISRAGWPRSTPMSGTTTHAVTATMQRRARQLGHRELERRRRLPGLRDEPAEAADLGLGADRDDDALAAAVHHGAAGVDQRGPLGERRAGVDRLGPLGGRHGLARQPGLVGGQAVGLDDAGVGGDDAAGLDEQHVADDERVDRDGGHGALPPDERVRGAQVAQRPQRALGPDLGDRLDGADQRDDREDRDRVAQLSEDRREHADHDQQQLEGLHDGLDQLLEHRLRLALFGAHRRRCRAAARPPRPSGHPGDCRSAPTRPRAALHGPGRPAPGRRHATRALRSPCNG